jgi:3-(3-hydroxy-phenyl)propionate hydroxylase
MKTDSSLAAQYDVAVIGYGPAGATLANLLALQGIRTLVLDREADIYRLPRAVHFDGECMRVFQTIGIADALVPGLVVAPGMRFVSQSGELLLDWTRPTQIGPQGWHPSYRFHQPTLEGLLRERLAHQTCADVRLRHDVFSIELDADGVTLRLEDLSSGRLLQTRAKWVVGCDGARSTVRRFMGTELEDLRSHERWLVVDVILKRERPDLGDHSIQYCDPSRPATYVRGPGMRRRWELMLMPKEDPAAMSSPDAIWSLLSRWVTPDDAVLERPAVYTFHSVVAQGWRKGRLLIAGDAAHQTPPFMGQGMCAGIRDASNLAWKLAEVVQGRSKPDLLDTYESERSPHVREFIETAVKLGKVIQTTDPQEARQRDDNMRATRPVFSTPSPQLGPGHHNGAAPAGHIGEQPALIDGERMDDPVGYRPALLVDPSLTVHGQSDDVVIIQAHSSACQDWLMRLQAKAVLLRPDRYVFGVAQDAASLTELLGRWSHRFDAASANDKQVALDQGA